MKTSRIIGLLMALVLLLSATVGLAEVEPSFPLSEEPITLTFFVQTNATADDFAKTCENSELLKMIAEKTNITLELIPILDGEESKQKLVLALAAGNYPDGAMMSNNGAFNRSDIMQYGVRDGYLLALDEYIDAYAPNILEVFGTHDGLRSSITATDGHIYGIPRMAECRHCTAYPKLWFNYDWLEKLGLEEPQTIEELYDVLTAFVTQDPNGNGIADEIGMTANISFSNYLVTYLMNSFMDCPAFQTASYPRMYLHWNPETESVEFLANKPEFKEGLEWIKKFYDAGLISPAALTQEQDQMRQEVLASEDVATVGCFVGEHFTVGGDWERLCREKNYRALPPVAGPEGVRYQPYDSYANQISCFNFVLFDTCEHPEAAVKLADWFYTPEMTMTLGWNGMLEGGGWTLNDDPTVLDFNGNPMYGIVNPEWEQTTTSEERSRWTNVGLQPYGDTADFRASIQRQPNEESIWLDYGTFLDYETTKLEQYFPEVCLIRDLFMDSADSEEFNELRLTINSYVAQNASQFVTGARSLDEWDAYCAELDNLKIDRYVEIYNQYYNK